jgi:hypothetical protein
VSAANRSNRGFIFIPCRSDRFTVLLPSCLRRALISGMSRRLPRKRCSFDVHERRTRWNRTAGGCRRKPERSAAIVTAQSLPRARTDRPGRNWAEPDFDRHFLAVPAQHNSYPAPMGRCRGSDAYVPAQGASGCGCQSRAREIEISRSLHATGRWAVCVDTRSGPCRKQLNGCRGRL